MLGFFFLFFSYKSEGSGRRDRRCCSLSIFYDGHYSTGCSADSQGLCFCAGHPARRRSLRGQMPPFTCHGCFFSFFFPFYHRLALDTARIKLAEQPCLKRVGRAGCGGGGEKRPPGGIISLLYLLPVIESLSFPGRQRKKTPPTARFR